MPKTKLTIIFSAILFFGLFGMAKGSQAADWYVRPSGGSGSGTSWTAAWNGFPAIDWNAVQCGDTIWVAGGTYGDSLIPNKSCSSGSQLYIRRARTDASACTGATGWSSGYDSTIVQNTTYSGIGFIGGTTSNYIIISGRTTAAGGGYGWKVGVPPNTTTGTGGIGFYGPASVNHVTMEYLEVVGPDAPQLSTVYGQYGIDSTMFAGSASYLTFSHISIHGWTVGGYNFHENYSVYEYIDMYNIYGNSLAHPDLFFMQTDSNNGTIRYSKFHDSCAAGSGIYFEGWPGLSNWNIYGNSFYDMAGGGVCVAIGLSTYPDTGVKIFNNTFSNVDINMRVVSSATCDTGCETRNNIFNGGSTSLYGTASNNLTTSNTGIFTNYAGNDFHIVSATGSGYPRNAGTSLSSYFTTDMDGTTFGGDGAWDIGAYEYSAGGGGAVCGDSACNGKETCSSCPADCGTCPTGNLPDFIITGISWTPAQPNPGDSVTFKATIKNQGTAATPSGTIHGVLFSVDSTDNFWSDSDTSSLAPGASVTLTANGGPSGSATWTATSGTHQISANVDDVNRITESDESNNTLSVSATIGGPDTTPPAAPSGLSVN